MDCIAQVLMSYRCDLLKLNCNRQMHFLLVLIEILVLCRKLYPCFALIVDELRREEYCKNAMKLIDVEHRCCFLYAPVKILCFVVAYANFKFTF